MLVAKLLSHLIRVGALTVIDANDKSHHFVGKDRPAKDCKPLPLVIRLHDKRLHHRLFFQPQLATGEAYMNGTLTIENGSIYDFVELIGRNWEISDWPAMNRFYGWIDYLFRHFQQFNPLGWSRINVAHHYNLSESLYELFLDSDKQYSCAYFEQPEDDLETAQENKKRRIASKLLLQSGQKVLDIGCGWGGLALYLAKYADVQVDGLTLSSEQLRVARERADREGLADRVKFHLCDYREHEGIYDRIVSVGMFEHVGVNFYPRYFKAIHDLLDEDGIALLHSIGRTDGPGTTDPWIRKYIFPGGYSPALSEVTSPIESQNLTMTDIEILRLHYAETIRHWRNRFQYNRQLAADMFDERFCRMWEYYLAASEMSFRHMKSVVFQIQMAKHQEAAPMTRQYLSKSYRNSANERDQHAA